MSSKEISVGWSWVALIGLLMAFVLIVGVFCSITAVLAYDEGRADCKAITAELEYQEMKARALTIEASRILANNTDMAKDCNEYGRLIAEDDQKITWTDNSCLDCHIVY